MVEHAALSRRPNVFTIPPGAPFLDTLAEALLAGTLVPGFDRSAGPLELAAATIYVPTRRAARALGATFATHLGAAATFLPRILPLGALENLEDGLLLDPGLPEPLEADLPAAIGATERRMILTRLILAWSASVRRAILSVDAQGRRATHESEALLVATTPADAWHLSGELAGLIDELATDGIAWHALKPLGTESFDRYWSITLDFLDIAMTQWPRILAERGVVDPAARQARLIDAEVARLAALPPGSGPVIVAGSTGTQTPTARLMRVVARLPQGAVILPGLDGDLDDAGWDAIGAAGDAGSGIGHPQAALHRLLPLIGVARDAVVALGAPVPALSARARVVSEAMRPAETTDAWRGFATGARVIDRAAALAGVSLVEAADEREEALALAVALRETLEGDGSAMLVTPDRSLARRVRAEMTRWGIEIDDSGGTPLGQTPAGALARLVLDAVVRDRGPLEVLALLAHAAVRLGRPRGVVEELSRTAEIVLLRGVLPQGALADVPGLIGRARTRAAADHAPGALRRLSAADFAELEALLAAITTALAPLSRLGPGLPLGDWLVAHEAVIAALIVTESGEAALGGADGTVLAELFDDLAAAVDPAIVLDRLAYAALFERVVAESTVRGPARSHPRLKILGPLEARLLSADRILLGGLDETVWPPQVRADAFLNRPMRAALGLAAPERRIGQSAHDFVMALGQPDVIISRAAKRGGSPTVPSRFLQRMQAIAGESWGGCRARGDTYLTWARALDRPRRAVAIRRPAPKPPVAMRPDQLSVTRIELLRRDPYAIYADRILRLRPLDPVGAAFGPREWGTAFHAVLSAFTAAHRHGPLPPTALEALLQGTQDSFAEALEEAGFRAFMGARLDTWARAFHAWEGARRDGLAGIHVEERGALALPLADGSVFTLTAHADRIETARSGGLRIIDYKTGAAPSKKEVGVGFAPQLTLEAAMAAKGAFAALGPDAIVDSAHYVKFGAGADVIVTDLAWKERSFADVVDDHFRGLLTLLESFRDPDTAYVARPFPQFLARHSDYDHLSRVKEWSATGGGDGEDTG